MLQGHSWRNSFFNSKLELFQKLLHPSSSVDKGTLHVTKTTAVSHVQQSKLHKDKACVQ